MAKNRYTLYIYRYPPLHSGNIGAWAKWYAERRTLIQLLELKAMIEKRLAWYTPHSRTQSPRIVTKHDLDLKVLAAAMDIQANDAAFRAKYPFQGKRSA